MTDSVYFCSAFVPGRPYIVLAIRALGAHLLEGQVVNDVLLGDALDTLVDIYFLVN